MTGFDGNTIVKLLKDGDWSSGIYSIKKKYEHNILITHGQKISVKLPFSKNTYYDEYLINLSTLVEKFNAFGISLVETNSFETYLASYGKDLNDDDKKFVSLYHYYIFKKR